MQEQSYFMVKPDGVARGLSEKIFNTVQNAGLKVVKKYRHQVTWQEAADLYSPHLGKTFYPGLIKFITSGPVICAQVSGENAILRIRELMGKTDPREAETGTIRGDLKEENIFTEDGTMKNLVHGSDSPESAKRELAIFFKEELK